MQVSFRQERKGQAKEEICGKHLIFPARGVIIEQRSCYGIYEF